MKLANATARARALTVQVDPIAESVMEVAMVADIELAGQVHQVHAGIDDPVLRLLCEAALARAIAVIRDRQA